MKTLPITIKPSASIGSRLSDSLPVGGKLPGKTFVALGSGVGEGAARVGEGTTRVGVRIGVDEGVIA